MPCRSAGLKRAVALGIGALLAQAWLAAGAAAQSGTDIVRMPTQPRVSPLPPAAPPSPASVSPTPQLKPPLEAGPSRPGPSQPAGRFIKLPVRLGSLASDPQKGWLGVRMEMLELPLATALGLLNTNGTLILEVMPGGPAGQAGIRSGDIIVSVGGNPAGHMNDLRQRVAATAPGTEAVFEVWRVAADGSDFLQALRRLADDGNATVMYRLGRMFEQGLGVAKNEAEAARWFRKGAAAGNLGAVTAYAMMVLQGRGAAKDAQEALRLLKVAADQSHPEAMHRLGEILLEGAVVTKDALEAARLFARAGETGHTPAMVSLGQLLKEGDGVQADHVKAAQWFKRAADLGNTDAMVDLGILYENGEGVPRGDTTAANLYRQAAGAGHMAGVHNLAAMMDNGRGVAKDPEQAAELVLIALDMGNNFSYKQMTENHRAWTKEFRRAFQRRLRDAGFYSSRIDGEFGDSTFAAVRAYMNRNR